MNSIASNTTSQAIQHFEENTKLRRSRRRTAMVRRIRTSPRPRQLSDRYLAETGTKSVSYDELDKWYFDFVRKKGVPDPIIFNERVTDAARKASQDQLTVRELEELQSILKSAWSPWANDDRTRHQKLMEEATGDD